MNRTKPSPCSAKLAVAGEVQQSHQTPTGYAGNTGCVRSNSQNAATHRRNSAARGELSLCLKRLRNLRGGDGRHWQAQALTLVLTLTLVLVLVLVLVLMTVPALAPVLALAPALVLMLAAALVLVVVLVLVPMPALLLALALAQAQALPSTDVVGGVSSKQGLEACWSSAALSHRGASPTRCWLNAVLTHRRAGPQRCRSNAALSHRGGGLQAQPCPHPPGRHGDHAATVHENGVPCIAEGMMKDCVRMKDRERRKVAALVRAPARARRTRGIQPRTE